MQLLLLLKGAGEFLRGEGFNAFARAGHNRWHPDFTHWVAGQHPLSDRIGEYGGESALGSANGRALLDRECSVR